MSICKICGGKAERRFCSECSRLKYVRRFDRDCNKNEKIIRKKTKYMKKLYEEFFRKA